MEDGRIGESVSNATHSIDVPLDDNGSKGSVRQRIDDTNTPPTPNRCTGDDPWSRNNDAYSVGNTMLTETIALTEDTDLVAVIRSAKI